MTKYPIGYIINLSRKEVTTILDIFDTLELPEVEVKEVEQFTPLEEVEEQKTESVDTVSKQEYDNLVKTIEELKNIITNNKE